MNRLNISTWSLVALGAAGAWAVMGVLAEAHRRKTAKLSIAQDVQEWENEGGSVPATGTASNRAVPMKPNAFMQAVERWSMRGIKKEFAQSQTDSRASGVACFEP